MTRLRVLLLSMFAGCAMLTTATPAARGEIVLMFSSSVADGAHPGQFTYTYNAVLTSLSELDKSGGSGNVQNGFTIYDVNGYVANSASSSNASFTASSANVGATYLTQSPTDDANIANVTFLYNAQVEFPIVDGLPGDPQIGPLGIGPFLLGTVKFNSTEGRAVGLLYYSAATQRSVDQNGSDEQIANNTSRVLGPFGSVNTPEPGTLVLLAIGAGAVLLYGRRRAVADRQG